MKILCFDTSTDTMFVNISEDGNVLVSKKVLSTKGSYNSAFLISTIVELLKELDLTMEDIEAVGVNAGPGSFTGIRASATVARIISQQLNIPAVGVSSMEIYSVLNETAKNTLVLMDARRGKSYFAVYDPSNREVIAPATVEYNKALEEAGAGKYFIVSDKRMAKRLDEIQVEYVNYEVSGYNFGHRLAELVFNRLKLMNKDELSWFNLKPLYIQPPPISTPNK